MALWPFGKKKDQDKDQDQSRDTAQEQAPVEPTPAETTEATDAPEAPEPATQEAADLPVAPGATGRIEHDPVNGNVGPFDGDSVDINDFDFSDFSASVLNLGSMRLPLPKESQVQVEMNDQGPRMLHIVTHHGRMTPVAFAAPSSGGQWENAIEEIAAGMREQGLPVTFEMGPWGREVVGHGGNGAIRIMGMDGPRWMLRITCVAPSGKEEQLATLAREMAARAFVYRGDDPILAGNSLPVMLPQQLAEQVQEAVQQRAQQQKQAQAGQAQHEQPQQPQQPQQPGASENQMHEAMQRLMNNQNPNGKQN